MRLFQFQNPFGIVIACFTINWNVLFCNVVDFGVYESIKHKKKVLKYRRKIPDGIQTHESKTKLTE